MFNDLQNLRNKKVTLMNKKSEIYRACWPKMNFLKIFLSTYNPINGIWLFFKNIRG